jgi:phosphate transport system substrate-binding protein
VAASPTVWKLKTGSTVEWPADTSAGNGNPGVAQIISGADGAIGYVDLSDAEAANLKWAKIKNSAGKFIEPSADTATKAGGGITVKPDLTFSAVNTTAPDGYPITAPSWVIVYANQTDAAKGALVKAYVAYLIGDGQKVLSDLSYAALPDSLQKQAVTQLDQIKVG